MLLELGTGRKPTSNFIHHDRTRHSDYIDVAWDLNKVAWECFEDESCDQVRAIDVFEHLGLEVHEWLNECWRILKPDGLLVMRLPAWDNPLSWRDPTHKRVFHLETFHYWDKSQHHWREWGSIYYAEFNQWWHVLDAHKLPDSNDYGYVLRKEVTTKWLEIL